MAARLKPSALHKTVICSYENQYIGIRSPQAHLIPNGGHIYSSADNVSQQEV